MQTPDLQWLAAGLKRHLIACAQTYWRREGAKRKFGGLDEQNVVSFLERIYHGLGYLTWLECSYPKPAKRRKVDLWAEDPDGVDWLIEVKVLWADEDNRLYAKRFQEILRDFDKLGEPCEKQFHELIVWVVFSTTREVRIRGEGANYLHLGDAEREVARRGDRWGVAARTTVNLGKHCDCPRWQFAHVLCWTQS